MTQEPTAVERNETISIQQTETAPAINPEVLAIADQVIQRIRELLHNEKGDLVVSLKKWGKRTNLNRSATIRHIIPEDDVDSKVALLELASELQKRGISILRNPDELDNLLKVNNVELNVISISEIDEDRGIRFTVANKGRYKMDLSISIFKLKSKDTVDDLFQEKEEALKDAEEELKIAEDKYEKAKKTKSKRKKDKAEKKLARTNVLNCRRCAGGLKYHRDRLVKAKKNRVRYIDKPLCLNIKRDNASDEIARLIESGELLESDREIVSRLFHQGSSQANGMSDINMRVAHKVRKFYEIIKNVHAGLEKLKLL